MSNCIKCYSCGKEISEDDCLISEGKTLARIATWTLDNGSGSAIRGAKGLS
jgi:hypothetical protein